MPLPDAWIDRLFAKLTVRYGETFMRQYHDMDIELVKADWAEVLDGFQYLDGSIMYALRYLPSERPPSALQFRDICRRAPEIPKPALTAPAPSRDDISRFQATIAELKAVPAERAKMTPAQWCYKQIHEIAAQRGHFSRAQKEQLSAIEAMWQENGQGPYEAAA